jgi:hypothetical protein
VSLRFRLLTVGGGLGMGCGSTRKVVENWAHLFQYGSNDVLPTKYDPVKRESHVR